MQDGDAPGCLGHGVELDVDEFRDPHEPLRRHRGRQFAHDSLIDENDLNATTARPLRERMLGRGHEQAGQARRVFEGLSDRLRALDEEPSLLLADGALLQLHGCRDLRVAQKLTWSDIYYTLPPLRSSSSLQDFTCPNTCFH